MVRAFSLAVAIFAMLVSGAQASVIGRINEAQRVTLSGNTRPEATPANDRGTVPDSFAMPHMQLALQFPGENAFADYVDGLSDPRAANFHIWLTAEQVGARYGLGDSDIATITRWLTVHGFEVNRVYTNHAIVDFSGTAGDVKKAFGTEIHFLSVNGVRHFANMKDPQIPVALAPAVAGIVSLHDFSPQPTFTPAPMETQSGCGSTCYYVAPADLATIYDFKPLFAKNIVGKSQTIVVIETSDVYSKADWSRFRTVFGLDSYGNPTLTETHPAPKSGKNDCSDPGATSSDGEAILDTEWASAAAPAANIVLASCKGTTTPGFLIAVENLVSESKTPPAIISISYGECEASLGSAQIKAASSTFETAAAEGVSVFVSAGDSSGAACDSHDTATAATHGIAINGMAATAYATAVGGTDFADTYDKANSNYWSKTNSSLYGSAKSYIPEIPWNGSCASALRASFLTGSGKTYGAKSLCNTTTDTALFTVSGGAGGLSCCTAEPKWQKGVAGIPADKYRNIPDVVLFASAGGTWRHSYTFCDSAKASCSGAPSGWSHGGGTSFAAPIWAGIQALIDQDLKAREGNAAPVLYALAAKEYGKSGDAACRSEAGKSDKGCVFHDIIEGDNDVNCTGTKNCYRPSGKYGVLSLSNTSFEPAYRAATGWDFATGLGSPDVSNLLAAWKANGG